MTEHVDPLVGAGSRRRRLVSATYEGVGARWKEQLREVSLAVYEECPQIEEIATKVAQMKNAGSFFLMEASRVETVLDEWSRALPSCTPFYPLSCNDDPLLLQLLTRNNHANLQVSTLAELEVALSLVAPSRIVFHSHLLTKKMLRVICSLPEPLYSLVVDNEDSAVDAAALNPFQPLLMRTSLSPDSDHVDLAIGMPAEEAMECVPRLIRSGVPICGLSVQFMGEGENMVERGRELIELLATLVPSGISILEVGDNFHAASLDDTSYILECILEAANATHVKLMATPGRFLAAACFTLVTYIVGKRSMDAQVITRRDEDWGREGFLYETSESVYGVFANRMMGEKALCLPLPLVPLCPLRADSIHHSAVIGSAVDGIDFPQRHSRLPSLAVGDCLMWKEMGAYAARESDEVPVYYFTGRAHWERLKGEEKELMSDGASEGETDIESEMYDEDMTECFGRVFN